MTKKMGEHFDIGGYSCHYRWSEEKQRWVVFRRGAAPLEGKYRLVYTLKRAEARSLFEEWKREIIIDHTAAVLLNRV